jgi:transcriptional regulator with XRE-family HTH domain
VGGGPMSKIFAGRLKAERKYKDWTQEVLAGKIGITIGTLSGYERNYREPDFDTVIKIAGALDVSIDYLLGRTNSRNPYKGPSNIELEEFLKNNDVTFNGAVLDGEDKKDVLEFLRMVLRRKKK